MSDVASQEAGARREALADAALREFRARTITVNGIELKLFEVFKAIKDDDLENEADRRGILEDWGDCDCEGDVAFDLRVNVPDWILRQDINGALARLEGVLASLDGRFAGFAHDVERHFRS